MGSEETEHTGAEKREHGGIDPEKKKAGLVNARRRNAGGAQLGRSVLRPYNGNQLLEFFGHDRELELGFG
jgi:hypothetical protein